MARLTPLSASLYLIALLAVLLLAWAPQPPAQAGSTLLQPTRFDDPAPNGCQPDDCSLREAVIAANQTPGQDVILLDQGTYHLSIPGADEDGAQTGDLDITDDLVLTGVSFEDTTVDGGAMDRVFDVSGFATVRMGWLTVGNGSTSDRGGGIRSFGDLTLLFARVRGSDSLAGGGGIYAAGDLRVYYSWISGNTTSGGDPDSAGRGAGLFLDGGQGASVSITNSGITGNIAAGYLGGLHDQGFGNVSLTNVTISGNTGYWLPGIDEANGTMTLNNVTIADNTSTGPAGGALYTASTVILTNTIVQHANVNCELEGSATIMSNGHNIAGDDTCNLTAPGDLPNTDSLLQPLGDNGGLTPTHALAPGSPARDAGDPSSCPDTDQRGRLRPPASCDIGAFEADAGLPPNPIQGDVNCDGTANAVDALGILRAVAGLAVTQQEPCVDPGEPFWFGATQGNVNCDYGQVNAVDALAVLRYVAGLPVTQNEQFGPCPDIGTHLIPD